MATDAQLVRRSLDGDREALTALVERHVGPVRASILAHLGRSSDVDDLTQETLLRGIRDLGRLRDGERLGPWLRGIARHLCIDVLRKKYRLTVALDDSPQEWPAPCPEPEPDTAPLRAAVLQLPLKLREAILLFYVEGASYDAIARQLEITPAAVNRRLTRARQMLRDRLVGKEGSA